MAVVGYQVANFLIFFLNCYSRILPGLTKASLYISLISFTAITLAILIASPQKATAKSVFRSYTNHSGWESDVICFFTGLLGVNWGFSCLDACTHMAEEIPKPERNVPKAILGTVAIGFVTSWVYSIAIFFSIQDIDAVISTPTFVPSIELFRQALRGSVAGAVVLQSLVILTGIGCLMSVHTWTSRLVYQLLILRTAKECFVDTRWIHRCGVSPATKASCFHPTCLALRPRPMMFRYGPTFSRHSGSQF